MLVPGFLVMAGAFYSLESEPMQLQSLSKFDWLGFALFVAGFASLEYLIQDGTLKNWFSYQPIVYKDASILFNVVLITGMTIGIAFLKEFQSHRSQFHSSHINEAVSLYDLITVERIDRLTQYFLSQGGGLEQARDRMIEVISGIIARESSVMGFADCYYVVGWVLIFAAGLVFLVKKPRK